MSANRVQGIQRLKLLHLEHNPYDYHHHHHLPPWTRSFDLFWHRRMSSFPAASALSSSSGFVVEGAFRESVVIRSGNHPKENKILISRDAQPQISADPYGY